MTPLQFEATYAPLWDELEDALHRTGRKPSRRERKQGARQPGGRSAPPTEAPGGARLSELYRRTCEHLALAQARAYPIHLTQRLEGLTQRAHRVVYRGRDPAAPGLKRLMLVDFPQSVRAHRLYLLVAALLVVLPMLAVGWAAYRDPGFILHLASAGQVREYESMYGDGAPALGRLRSADTDWKMFGHYVMHNIGIGFQCFAGGIFAGIGSAWFMLFNGAFFGGLAGHLTARGHGENFYSFVITHSAFELTAIVLAGAGGLRLGHALLAPGRRTRLDALQHAARDAIVVVYGVVGLLLVAAAVEAFWSSARWVAPGVKYGVGAACWAMVVAYLGWQGRPARAAGGSHAG